MQTCEKVISISEPNEINKIYIEFSNIIRAVNQNSEKVLIKSY